MKLLPEHLKGALGILSMSRAELAAVTGVGEATIWRFETGKTVPRDETLLRIQTALEQRGIIFHNSGRPGVSLDLSKAVIQPKAPALG